MSDNSSALKLLILLLSVALLPACEKAEEPPQTGADAPMAGTPPRPRPDPTADMVSAVSTAKVAAPVELKFALSDRPQVGRSLEIEIAVLPIGDVDRIVASFQAGAGLELRQGEQMAQIENPEAGAPISHKITIVPQRDGIFFVSAVVHVDSPTESITRTFSIPIIAGTSVPEVQGGSAAPDQPNSETP